MLIVTFSTSLTYAVSGGRPIHPPQASVLGSGYVSIFTALDVGIRRAGPSFDWKAVRLNRHPTTTVRLTRHPK